ncbi:hypothetical protein [Conexibacter sp. CPCC 206217]|uniref:hypothetical protein n=1 Tax=Conexibacter sp. CPCC 206217 TaxID=3064574 RepID=UPI00271B10A0|nr:hypothetical protein [Conexibacter sp. CPCC 206217]MDO8210159.1 hypothetical protein [Conexibacter sp. CPCC 206217]
MSVVPSVTREALRAELAADLGRGGYVLRAGGAPHERRWFEKALVLSRPGLLQRAAALMAALLPPGCERLAVTSVPSAALGAALAQATGVPLLLGSTRDDGTIAFEGEAYPGMRTVLLEDVVCTGGWAARGAAALREQGAELSAVVALLDRDAGAATRLADAGVPLRALFGERELLELAHVPAS